MADDKKPHNPHDRLARKIFGRADVAAGFFREYYPESLGKRIRVEDLLHEPVSFIDPELRERRADLLYRLKDPSGETLLYCLFEHQSQPDPWMPLRLLRYMLRVWEYFLENHPGANQLPPIAPIVLHQGKGGWTAAKTFGELFSLPGGLDHILRPNLPDFTFHLVDLAPIPFGEMRGHILGRLGMQALKAAGDGQLDEFLDSSNGLWQDLVRAEGNTETAEILFRYVFRTASAVDKERIRNKVQSIQPTELRQTVMTFAEQLIEEGIEQGIEKKEREIVLKMNALGKDADEIASLTGIEVARVIQHLSA